MNIMQRVLLKQLKKQTSESIKIYNEQRPHLSNQMLTPEIMHLQELIKPKKWHKKLNLMQIIII